MRWIPCHIHVIARVIHVIARVMQVGARVVQVGPASYKLEPPLGRRRGSPIIMQVGHSTMQVNNLDNNTTGMHVCGTQLCDVLHLPLHTCGVKSWCFLHCQRAATQHFNKTANCKHPIKAVPYRLFFHPSKSTTATISWAYGVLFASSWKIRKIVGIDPSAKRIRKANSPSTLVQEQKVQARIRPR
jgi:hypothetical protein